jgi:hypothetical protein
MFAKWRFGERRTAPDGIRKSPASATEGRAIAAFKAEAPVTTVACSVATRRQIQRVQCWINCMRHSYFGRDKRFDCRGEGFLRGCANLQGSNATPAKFTKFIQAASVAGRSQSRSD